MEINSLNKSNEFIKNDISPISKMKLRTAEKTKEQSKYWIDHFKFKQKLINQLNIIKYDNSEKYKNLSNINFSKESEILCDNLYKLTRLTNYSQIKLDNNLNKMKMKESNEEIQKQEIMKIFEKNLETIKNIENTSEEINIQKELLNSWQNTIENMKKFISELRNENCLNIDNFCKQYSQDSKELKKISKIYNLLCNITKYRIFEISDMSEQQIKIVRGYLLNIRNGDILKYDISFKNDESVENKAMKVFQFWKTYLDFNQIISK